MVLNYLKIQLELDKDLKKMQIFGKVLGFKTLLMRKKHKTMKLQMTKEI